MTKDITLKVGEMVAVKGKYLIKSIGIGSCVVVVIFDKEENIAAMCHSMLPSPLEGDKSKGQGRFVDNVQIYDAKYVESTIPKMLDLVLKLGGRKDKLKAKIVGGATMFKSFSPDNSSVGTNNVTLTKKMLNDLKLTIKSENTGGNHGRSVSFNTTNAVMSVNSRI
ncbi:hypothetical protein C0583_04910 [Candidatus Parcubacteria bacterium]|nr:MAG: hypothetical protein C0583_04910 [Candidatus Parcubacteria bacterium]